MVGVVEASALCWGFFCLLCFDRNVTILMDTVKS
ncbi:hypothetical protein P9902_23 [Streptococcus phage P9902]|uniref:Uncharacterized protein n=2 Tax=Moineauvirus TaxID=1623304 RepID=A0A286QS83_9CAUD|nr:hypothetical protein PP249_gp23 [Streptococcus phage P9902]YP_010647683.1 hypothetical protein PP250_gp25 [Streptococcus phage P9903]ARU14763.1 hypothetical protein P9902_23 [Streptococcus phage P9902]ARU14815.1 hypothetical protein P9903_25 [Streptococcus phage P9903]